MHIFLEYFGGFKEKIIFEKIEQSLGKIKKGAQHSRESFQKEESEKLEKKTASKVTDVKIAADGTIRTYFNDEKYPVIGYNDFQSVWVVATYKRLFPLIAKNVSRMGFFKRGIAVLGLLFSSNILAEWFEFIFAMHNVLPKEEYYCPAVKEIRKVLKWRVDERLIDGFTAILEFDTAYKYPVQDILPLLDKQAFNKNWKKELTRLLGILLERANPQDAIKFKNIGKLVVLYLTCNRKALKKVKEIVHEINLDNIAPSREDYYWMCYLATYNCFGMTVQEREEIRIKLNNETLVGVGS